MKTLKTLFLLLIYIMISQGASSNLSRYETVSPQEIPKISFTDKNGYPIDLSNFKGKIVLLNIWSLGCGPCIAEMPSLDNLAGMFPDEDFVIVPLNIDPLKSIAIVDFYNKSKFQYLTIYLDPYAKTKEALHWRGLPTTIILNREGKMIGRMVGATSWDSPEAIELIEALIKGKTPNIESSLLQKFSNFMSQIFDKRTE